MKFEIQKYGCLCSGPLELSQSQKELLKSKGKDDDIAISMSAHIYTCAEAPNNFGAAIGDPMHAWDNHRTGTYQAVDLGFHCSLFVGG